MWIRSALIFLTVAAPGWGASSEVKFEGLPALQLDSGKVMLQVLPRGSSIVSVVLSDESSKLNPLWNPTALLRAAGREAQATGGGGHFVCVDGFGQPSVEERAAGFPGHGEAHTMQMEVLPSDPNSISLRATLPIMQEVFTRTFNAVAGENIIYVDSVLENLLGFDRPVNWAEHATIDSPFLDSGKTTIYLSGTRSRVRPYAEATARAAANPAPAGGGGRGGNNTGVRRLVSNADFTWPMAPGLDGSKIDMHAAPENPHYLDHAATLLDPSRKFEYVVAINSERKLIFGYLFRREDYPWLQHWGNYSGVNQLVRGMEFGTQPYDISHRDVITNGPMFDTPTIRWMGAKSRLESHFLLFYAHAPEGMKQVNDVRLENGSLVIEDKAAGKTLKLAASRGL
jgi:hypothetical protein